MASTRRPTAKGPGSRRKPTQAHKGKTRITKILEQASAESERVMRSELDAERLPAGLLTLQFKNR
jgi:hypothetical protein